MHLHQDGSTEDFLLGQGVEAVTDGYDYDLFVTDMSYILARRLY